MSNTTTTTATTPEIVVTADAAVVKAIGSYVGLEVKSLEAEQKRQAGYIGIAESSIPVVKRQGYTSKKQVQNLLLFSFYAQAGVSEGTDDQKAGVLKARQTDIYNLSAIILPKNDDCAAGRDKAIAFNKALPAGRVNQRIGQKLMLDICRGTSTADDVIAVKEGREPSKATKTSGNQANAEVGRESGNSATKEASQDANPEAQTATVPTADANQVVVSNPGDLIRNALRALLPNMKSVHGLSTEDIVRIVREEAQRFQDNA